MILRLVTALAALALLAGCSSEEGLRAQELLRQAEAAQAQLRSSTFEGGLSITADGTRMELAFRGATSPEGEWFSLRAGGMRGGEAFSLQVLNRSGRVSVNMGGGWQPAPAGAARPEGTMSAEAFQQLARYVRDVRVTAHQLIDGKPKTTIAGEIDTAGLLQAATELGSLAPEGVDLDLSDLGVEFGDIEAVLTIDEETRLLDSALVGFGLEAQGKTVRVELRYRLASANEPVELPRP